MNVRRNVNNSLITFSVVQGIHDENYADDDVDIFVASPIHIENDLPLPAMIASPVEDDHISEHYENAPKAVIFFEFVKIK